MNHFILITLITLILIEHNIVLLNEETLILVCFIGFGWFSSEDFLKIFEETLGKKSSLIELNLKNSLKNISSNLRKILNVQERFWNLFYNFKQLGSSCLIFISSVMDWLVVNSTKTLSTFFPKKLQFIARLEKQTIRLLSMLIIFKLKKVTKLKHFHSAVMRNTYLVCLNRINTREYIQIIDKS